MAPCWRSRASDAVLSGSSLPFCYFATSRESSRLYQGNKSLQHDKWCFCFLLLSARCLCRRPRFLLSLAPASASLAVLVTITSSQVMVPWLCHSLWRGQCRMSALEEARRKACYLLLPVLLQRCFLSEACCRRPVKADSYHY